MREMLTVLMLPDMVERLVCQFGYIIRMMNAVCVLKMLKKRASFLALAKIKLEPIYAVIEPHLELVILDLKKILLRKNLTIEKNYVII